MESISIANKILQDPKRSCKILQDPRRSYKILRDTRQKCFGIHINSKQDPTRFCKILQDPTRFYGILNKHAMESISIANKILQDSTGYQTKRLWNPYQQQTRSYKILRDTRQKYYGIHINSKQDRTRFYGILDKNAMESISIANKILQDPKRSCKILQDPTRSYKILRDTRQKCFGIHINSKQDPTRFCKILQDRTRFYGILDKNAMESILIANKILQDSTGYQTNMLWNPYQQQTRSYKILRDTRQKCYGIHINTKQDPTRS